MPRQLRSCAAAATLLGVVALLCFSPLVLNPRSVLVGPQRAGWNDLTTYFIPVHSYPRECMAAFGQWPLWNPYLGAGVPHWGNPQAALFYPPNWLCWWFDAAQVLSWSLVFHHWWAGVGAFQLCRGYGMSWGSSLLAGSMFLAAPYLMAHTGEGHYAQICAVAWMPWTVRAYERLRCGDRGGVELTAATLALGFLAGHIQEVYYLAVILTVWAVLAAWGQWRRGERAAAGWLLGRWVVAGVIAGALVAVDLLGMLVYARQTARAAGLDAAGAGSIRMGLANLLQLFDPFALGGPQSYAGSDRLFWESLCAFGVVPLVLAVFGAIAVWVRAARADVADPAAGPFDAASLVRAESAGNVRAVAMRWGVTWLIALAFGFGLSSPVFRLLYALLPGVAFFRVPSRVLFFCSLAIAVLAAVGAETLAVWYGVWSARAQRIGRRMVLGAIAAMLLAAGALEVLDRWGPVRAAGGEHESHVRRAIGRSLGSGTTYAWFLGAAGLLYAGMRFPAFPRGAVRALWVLGVVQLTLVSSKLLRPLQVAEYRRPGIESIEGDSHGNRVLAAHEFVPPIGLIDRDLLRVQAYDPVPLARYEVFFSALVDKPDPSGLLMGAGSPDVARLRERLLDFLGVRWVVLHGAPAEVPEQFGWRLVGSESVQPFQVGAVTGSRPEVIGSVYENGDALPRAFVVGRTRVLPRGGDAIAALVELDPRLELLMTAEFLPPGARAEFAAARIVEYTPNRVVVEADLPAVGYVVMSDNWYPGWQATDNGRPTSVIPANLSFRAVPLAPGPHRIEFRYRPRELAVGGVISVAAWLALVVSMTHRRVFRFRATA